MATPSQAAGTAVVGYFSTGDEAHRAINALIDGGFQPNEIGAAFHTGSNAGRETGAGREDVEVNRRPNVGGELRDELGTTYPETTLRSYGGPGASTGASSGTESVQYAALGGGAGTPTDGAGRPGPIPGSDVEHSGLPSELKHDLPHDSDVQSSSGSTASMQSASTPTRVVTEDTAFMTPATPPGSQIPLHTGAAHKNSWGEKLKHVFGGHQTTERIGKDDLQAEMKRDSQDFGTGEGHLNLVTPPHQRYSQSAFEKSFGGYGVESTHARHLSQRIGGGGAIITVHAGARTAEAERILEANGGQTRLSPGSTESEYTTESNVEVYGSLHRDYPGYL